jgi:Flp pilus assembly protein TadD
MLRSARTDRITINHSVTIRAAGFALASAALIAAATACGTEIKEPKDVVLDPVPVSNAGSTDSAGGALGTPDVVVPKVSLSDAELAYKDKRYSEATKLFSTYADQNPSNPWGHYMLGLSAWKSGDLDLAETAFGHSLELDPKHVKALHNLARVNLDQGRARDARDRLIEALEIDSSSGETYRLMGRVRAAMNQPNEAIAAYRVALAKDPTDAWSMNNMGLLMIQQGKNEEALGPLARAVQLDSTVAVFQNNLGIALEHTGRFALATQAYKAAVAVDGDYTKAKLSLARVEGRVEDPAIVPVELATLAQTFDREIRGVQMGGPVPPN